MIRSLSLLVVFLFAVVPATQAFSFFGGKKEDEKPRLSVLMAPASRLIDEASDLAAAGDTQKAVEKYRAALGELDAIKNDPRHAERLATPEFATFRTKRAYVEAAIDSLLLSQSKTNAKAVAVSDTSALERRLALEKRAAALVADLKAAPHDLRLLNQLAAVQFQQGLLADARATLEKAVEAGPRNYCAHYNLAELALRAKPPSLEAARRHYATGLKVGGPADPRLEARLK